VRAERDSWKAQFDSASAAASEYSEFWEKHSGDFDQFGNYIPYSQMDGDLRAAKAEIERLRVQPQALSTPDDDPTASKEWNEGCDFAMTQLCKFLGVEPSSISWDAATETVEGDVSAVIGNILRAKFGEDWGPDETLPEGTSGAACKAIEFCEWLSGYIGHGPAVQISSDQMGYIRSKVHPLMVELGVARPASPLSRPHHQGGE
jgi:hypothetical protein